MNRRVVITGLGLVTPLGLGIDQNWQSLIEGKSGISLIERFDTSAFDVKIAGEVKHFDPLQWINRKEQKRMDRFIQFSLVASLMALEDAGIQLPLIHPDRCGVLIGVGLGGLETLEEAAQTLAEKGPSRLSPFMIPKLIANLAPGHVSMHIGAQGPNLSSVSACATGAHSIGDAARLIAYGDADIMVAGGAEATITPLGIGGFAAMRALSVRNHAPMSASRPFDKDRDGFVASEGAGIMILESYEHAKARNAKIYAELIGYGQSSDAYHITQPSPDGRGARNAMLNALKNAKINPDQVDYLNAHGTSTPAGDQIESQAIRSVFNKHANQLWVSSTKSMTGHLLGAAGSVEAAICVLAIKHGIVPPTINLDHPDEGCDLDYVPWHARSKKIDIALSNSFGFGGTNVCLAFKSI
jgi:3-oxoacyl-[acyl-carrier-protein] synthase II